MNPILKCYITIWQHHQVQVIIPIPTIIITIIYTQFFLLYIDEKNRGTNFLYTFSSIYNKQAYHTLFIKKISYFLFSSFIFFLKKNWLCFFFFFDIIFRSPLLNYKSYQPFSYKKKASTKHPFIFLFPQKSYRPLLHSIHSCFLCLLCIYHFFLFFVCKYPVFNLSPPPPQKNYNLFLSYLCSFSSFFFLCFM